MNYNIPILIGRFSRAGVGDMGGIGVIWQQNGAPVDLGVLQTMASAAAARGPDGVGMQVDGMVGLLHQALQTTPESMHAEQPCKNRRSTTWITADTRLDNRTTLIRLLEERGWTFDNPPDAELILAAYDVWGEDCPRQLLGDFAFAIWDQERQRLFMARDHLGMRPLYYHFDRGRGFFACASEVRQLLTLPKVVREINEAVIGDFLVSGCATNLAETFFTGIYRVPPAHIAVVDLDGLRLRRYWSIDERREVRYGSMEEYSARFVELFQEAVVARMRSEGSLAIMLSGGLDSSSVAAMAAGMVGAGGKDVCPLAGFSAVYDELRAMNERPQIEAMVKRYGMVGHYHVADGCWTLRDYCPTRLGENSAAGDEPCPSTLDSNLNEICRNIRQSGARVALTGYFGDEVVKVNRHYYFNLAMQRQFHRLWQDLAHYRTSYGSWPPFPLKSGVRRMLPRRLRYALKPAHWGHLPPWINRDFVRRYQLEERWRDVFDRPNPARVGEEIASWITGPVVASWIGYVERIASRWSLETRHPFADIRLVTYMASIPPECFFDPQEAHKPFLKRAMGSRLPTEVLHAPKPSGSPLVYRGLREREVSKVRQILASPLIAEKGYVDGNMLRETYEKFVAGSLHDMWLIWYPLALEIWFKGIGQFPGVV
ncbi:MAG: asparagine synthetase B [Chloroflexi bacterium]|nr:asparagine synthetase B [Chloroflexota bacterium]